MQLLAELGAGAAMRQQQAIEDAKVTRLRSAVRRPGVARGNV